MTDRSNQTTYRRFQLVGYAEGISFILLLGIAMPLKYFAGMPQAVRVIGMAHGILFLLYIALLFNATTVYKWSFKKFALGFIVSLVPFGPFYADRMLKQ